MEGNEKQYILPDALTSNKLSRINSKRNGKILLVQQSKLTRQIFLSNNGYHLPRPSHCKALKHNPALINLYF